MHAAVPLFPDAALPAGPYPRGPVERPRRGEWLQVYWRRWFEWNVAPLTVRGLSPALAGLRIAHVTDLHLRARWHPAYDLLAAQLRERKPDLLLITGDFVDSKRNHRSALPTLHRLIPSFQAPLGCFAILGNHDTYRLAKQFDGTGVQLIDYRRVVLRVKSGTGDVGDIELIGLPGVNRRDLTPALAAAVPPRDATAPGTLRIVLSHFPDHLPRASSLRPDLFLTGHTHGGQVCLPGMVPIIKHDTLPRALCTGIHRVGPTWLVVSRGLGTTTLPIRLFCPPEVVEIVLSAE